MNQRSDNWTKNRRCFATVILPCENAKAGGTHSALHGHGYTVCHRRGRSNRSASVRLKLSSIQGEYSHCEGTLYAPPGVIYLGFLEAPPQLAGSGGTSLSPAGDGQKLQAAARLVERTQPVRGHKPDPSPSPKQILADHHLLQVPL